MLFQNLSLIDPILKAVQEEGYTEPTPIQEVAIPIVLNGTDLLGCAQTGTGKTAAFAIPILQLLHAETIGRNTGRYIKSLILTPTRELAIQIDESFSAYGRYCGLKHTVVYGGVSQKSQTDDLKAGIDILIATPGRLLDLYQQKFIDLRHVEIFVLDEADRMLDMGFIRDVHRVIEYLPKQRQTLFFSATMPPEISHLADNILHNPQKVAVTPVSSTVDKIKQYVYFTDKPNKRKLLIHILQTQPEIRSALVFSRTKHGADRLARELSKAGISTEAIHGDKLQNARQRALSRFKKGDSRVLVATDIAARGIDIDDLSHVINFDMPDVPETYVHRIGRTGRAGLEGTAISFCDVEEILNLRDINKLIGKALEIVEEHPFPVPQADALGLDRIQIVKEEKQTPVTSFRRKTEAFSSAQRKRMFRR
ncbi:MAG: DEAD/DEAH box helicase [Bacteroidales bacterium]